MAARKAPHEKGSGSMATLVRADSENTSGSTARRSSRRSLSSRLSEVRSETLMMIPLAPASVASLSAAAPPAPPGAHAPFLWARAPVSSIVAHSRVTAATLQASLGLKRLVSRDSSAEREKISDVRRDDLRQGWG